MDYEKIQIAFRVADFDAAYQLHKQMGCVCYENPWLEIMSERG